MSNIIISTVYPTTSNLKHEIQIRLDIDYKRNPFVIYVNNSYESCHWIIDDAIKVRDVLVEEYNEIHS